MKFRPTCCRQPAGSRRQAGFTLAEVLAALVFMAIVIPVAVEGIRIASRAGQVAERKAGAVRLAERLLNEITLTNQVAAASQSGMIQEGGHPYRWQMRTETWNRDSMSLVSLQVTFAVQGLDHDVRLSTLVDNSTQ